MQPHADGMLRDISYIGLKVEVRGCGGACLSVNHERGHRGRVHIAVRLWPKAGRHDLHRTPATDDGGGTLAHAQRHQQDNTPVRLRAGGLRGSQT
nr:MAG TPA: hypothetical protein [Caudoviricetes sp.]